MANTQKFFSIGVEDDNNTLIFLFYIIQTPFLFFCGSHLAFPWFQYTWLRVWSQKMLKTWSLQNKPPNKQKTVAGNYADNGLLKTIFHQVQLEVFYVSFLHCCPLW